MLSVGLKIGNSLNSSGRWTPALQEHCRASGGCCCLCRRKKPGAFPQQFNEISTVSAWDELLGLEKLCSAAENWNSKVDKLGRIGEKSCSGIIFLSTNLWRDWGISVHVEPGAAGWLTVPAKRGDFQLKGRNPKNPYFQWVLMQGRLHTLFWTEEFNTEIFE